MNRDQALDALTKSEVENQRLKTKVGNLRRAIRGLNKAHDGLWKAIKVFENPMLVRALVQVQRVAPDLTIKELPCQLIDHAAESAGSPLKSVSGAG